MAIINSVLTGKAKGKIGNIVLATVKGQTTAREYNPNPTYSDTTGQTLQRGRLRNAVLAWQFLNIFLKYAKPLAKSTESVYNAFIRLVVNLLPEAVYTTRAEAAGQTLAKLLYGGNFTTVSIDTVAAGSATISFDTNYFPWVSGIKIVLINYDTATGYRFVVVQDIIELEYNAGVILITDEKITAESCACYMVSADGSKISNIANQE